MKKHYYVLLIVIILVITLAIIFNIKENKVKDNEEIINSSENIDEKNTTDSNLEEKTEIVTNNIENVSDTELEDMKNSINATGDISIYQVEKEKDGRKILQIKPQIQFFVDLAGIIKKSIPEENELEMLVKEAPTTNGVWISPQSRELFLKLLDKNEISDFNILDNGYLNNNGNIKNDIEGKLEKMINSNKLYIINITGIAYQRDYISGEIVEYPFEDMDSEQVLESYRDENKIILELSTNKAKKLTDKEILETIVQY